MFYVHRDNYPNDYWWKGFSHVLESCNLNYKVIDLHKWDDFQEVNKEDYLLARFGHVKEDKNAIKSKLQKIYSVWNKGNIFPPRLAYDLYDDKWKEYKFLKKKNLPTLKSSFVKDKGELSKFLSEEAIDFPIVLKKPEGAGSNYVWRFSSLTEINSQIFPVLVQDYIPSNYDIRLFYLNNKFFAKKRIHNEGGSFPYGSLGSVNTERIEDVTSVLDLSFLKKVRMVFYENNNIPCMCFDILKVDDDSVIIEFSYCFNYKITLDCSHYYNILNSEYIKYYKDGKFENFEKIRYLVPREVIKWVTNDSLDIR